MFQGPNDITRVISMNQAWQRVRPWSVEAPSHDIATGVSGHWPCLESDRRWHQESGRSIRYEAQESRSRPKQAGSRGTVSGRTDQEPRACFTDQAQQVDLRARASRSIYWGYTSPGGQDYFQPLSLADRCQVTMSRTLCRTESAGEGYMLSHRVCSASKALPFLIWLIFPVLQNAALLLYSNQGLWVDTSIVALLRLGCAEDFFVFLSYQTLSSSRAVLYLLRLPTHHLMAPR